MSPVLSAPAADAPRGAVPFLRRAIAVLATAAAFAATGPAAADAARCPAKSAGGAAITVTWGTAVGGDAEIYPPADQPSGRIGAAWDGGSNPLVVRSARGGRTPLLCAGPRLLAQFPRPRAGERVVGASADGDRVAWRVARSNRSGRISAGRLRRGRVVAVRTVRTAATGQLRRRDGRITITPGGDVAWALEAGKRRATTTRLWVWPRGARPRRLPRPADLEGWVDSLVLASDQHLFLNARTQPLAFARPRPGSCARLAHGTWTAVGRWRVATVAGPTFGADNEESTSWFVVCDPASGGIVRIEPLVSTSDHYCASGRAIERVAAIGPWLALESRSTAGGSICDQDEVRTTLHQMDTGATPSEAGGGLSGPGIAGAVRRDPTTGGTAAADPTGGAGDWPAVVLTPGALAWAEAPKPLETRWPVMLSDAAGTRRVGTATTPSLALDTELRWTEDGVARSVPVVPVPGWTPAVVGPVGASR